MAIDFNGAIRILVVDDSDTMRMLLSITIAKLFPHAEITKAENGVNALKTIKEQEFDLIFTDMVMPVMGGADLIKQVRTTLNKTTPIIIISTKGNEQDRDFGLSLGANAYVTKPINLADLKEKIVGLS